MQLREPALHVRTLHFSFLAANARALTVLNQPVLLGRQQLPNADQRGLGHRLNVDQEVPALNDVALLVEDGLLVAGVDGVVRDSLG